MKMSTVLRSIKAADIEYINNSVVHSIPVMTTNVANTSPTIALALYAILHFLSCSPECFSLNHFKQELQIKSPKYALFLSMYHSPRGPILKIMVVYPAERHGESVCRLMCGNHLFAPQSTSKCLQKNMASIAMD